MNQIVNYSEAIASVQDGASMAAVARRYGVSRERIRQIVRKANIVPPTGIDARRALRDRVSELVLDGLTDQVIANHLGLTRLGVAADRRQMGLSEGGWRERRIELLRAGVEAGESIRQIAIKSNLHPTTLQCFAKRNGVVSLHGRHRDLSFRADLIRKWRDAGHTWEEIDTLLSEHEGRPNFRGAAYIWAKKYAVDVTFGRAGRHAAELVAAE